MFEGLALILFVGGLYVYYTSDRRLNALLVVGQLSGLVVGQLSGLVVGVGLIMNGVYSENFEAHGAWVVPTFFAMTGMLVGTNVALYLRPSFSKTVAAYGVAVGLLAPVMVFVTTPTLESPYVVVWILLYGALLWVVLVAADAFRSDVLDGEQTVDAAPETERPARED